MLRYLSPYFMAILVFQSCCIRFATCLGIPELRQQILDFHKEYDGFSHFHSDAMVVGAGSKEVLYLILNVFGGG